MNELQIFNHSQFGEIRTITENGLTLFCGSDVAKALGYKNPRKALADHCKGVTKRYAPTSGGQQEMSFIPEGDIYRLAARSELPGADAFERWIFDEVLPSIRKTGAYLTPELAKALADLPAVMELMAGMEERLLQMERRVDRVQPSGLMDITDIRPAAPSASFTPGLAARKRWMRTASEKLDLMSARFNTTHNEILHSLYQHLEKRCGVVLEEEKLRAMEEYNLVDCSVLTAVFYNPELRDAFEDNIDYNLAPENRGW